MERSRWLVTYFMLTFTIPYQWHRVAHAIFLINWLFDDLFKQA